MATEFVYRAHCAEILGRVAADVDTKPGTAAEVRLACRDAAMWERAFPQHPVFASQAAHYEAIRGTQITHLEAGPGAGLRTLSAGSGASAAPAGILACRSPAPPRPGSRPGRPDPRAAAVFCLIPAPGGGGGQLPLADQAAIPPALPQPFPASGSHREPMITKRCRSTSRRTQHWSRRKGAEADARRGRLAVLAAGLACGGSPGQSPLDRDLKTDLHSILSSGDISGPAAQYVCRTS
jgi:hypothetical protein